MQETSSENTFIIVNSHELLPSAELGAEKDYQPLDAAATVESSVSGEKSSLQQSKITRISRDNGSVYSAASHHSKRISCVTSKEFTLPSSKEASVKEKLLNSGLYKLEKTSSLHGREKEKSVLNDCFFRVAAAAVKERKQELVLVSGYSGTGKSTLAATLKDKVESSKHGVFLTGKYDLNLRDEPFSAISSVCCQLCWKIGSLRGGSSEQTAKLSFQDIRQIITEQIDSTELRLLTNIVPDLEDVVGKDSLSTMNLGNQQGTLETRDRVLFAFRKLFKSITEVFTPIVLVLDDLQWADTASLEFVKMLATYQDIPGLMIIGNYRSNEVDDTHFLSKIIRDVKGEAKDVTGITEIQVGNLDLAAINSIVMAMLKASEGSRTNPLAQLCLKRTGGNVFFLLSFVEMLQEEELIVYNIGKRSWEWDIAKVEKETAATMNVVDVVNKKMSKVDKESSSVLRLAACLGSQFRRETLFLVWDKQSHVEVDKALRDRDTFDRLLDSLIKERFLETLDESSLQFVHDKVQEAAMELIAPGENLAGIQYEVGRILCDHFDERELDANIFVVANLQNNADGTSSKISELNLQAAEKAQKMTAFDSCSHFISRGISFLPMYSWNSNKELTLKLHSLGAEVECCLGNFEKAEEYCTKVLEEESLQMDDKTGVYCIQINILQGLGKGNDAYNLALDVLNKLGCKIPCNKLAVTTKTMRTVWNLRIPPTAEAIRELPIMSDQSKIMCMKLLGMAGMFAHHLGEGIASMLISAVQVQWTLKYGICDQSASAFASHAVACFVFGDFQSMLKYTELALYMKDKTEANFCDPTALLIACNYGLAWAKPIQSISNRSMEGYKLGMQVGNSQMAMYCVFNHIHCSFAGGGSLKNLEHDCAVYSGQMLGLKRFECNDWTVLLWQSAHNLMGLSDNTTTLTGDIMNEEEYVKKQSSGSNGPALILFRYCKVSLCAYFGKYKIGARISIEKGDEYLKDLPANALGAFDAFMRGICLYAMAREKKQKYRKPADGVRAKLRFWVSKGNPNSVHHLKILDAEHKALNGKKPASHQMYQDAIILAAKGGFLHDAGLASERYAVTLLESGSESDKCEARHRIKESIRYYSEWGANYKVELLEDAYAKLLHSQVDK